MELLIKVHILNCISWICNYREWNANKVSKMEFNNKLLEELLQLHNQITQLVNSCVIWLLNFSTWNEFVKQNFLNVFVEND